MPYRFLQKHTVCEALTGWFLEQLLPRVTVHVGSLFHCLFTQCCIQSTCTLYVVRNSSFLLGPFDLVVHICTSVCRHPSNFTVSNSEFIHANNRHTLLQYTYLVQHLTSPFLLVLTEFHRNTIYPSRIRCCSFQTERNDDIVINFRLDVGRGKICCIPCFV